MCNRNGHVTIVMQMETGMCDCLWNRQWSKFSHLFG